MLALLSCALVKRLLDLNSTTDALNQFPENLSDPLTDSGGEPANYLNGDGGTASNQMETPVTAPASQGTGGAKVNGGEPLRRGTAQRPISKQNSSDDADLDANAAGRSECRRLVASYVRSASRRMRVPVKPVQNRAWFTEDGRLLWNGAEIDLTTFAQFLNQVTILQPPPELIFRVDTTAACDGAVRAARVIARTPVCSESVCRLEWNQRSRSR